ncbi:MAG: thiamine phosphate synthase [Bradyrhizobium sp.]|nr:thiamine phosphate synthase [Bradyrhizobium sp.]
MGERAGTEGGLDLSNKSKSGTKSGTRSATKPAPARPKPRLYLATPVVDDAAALAAELPGLLATADVAAVLVRLKETDQRGMISRVKALAPAVQKAGAALLIDGHAELVARAGADGAHLTGIAALEEAIGSLKPDRIAGAGGLVTRHDSMAAGEMGADYVLFGEPDARGQRPSAQAIAERLEWWAELFEPPCVGFATSAVEACEFAAAGADFVLVGDAVWSDPRGPKAALADAEAAIGKGYADATAPADTAQG